MVITCPDLSEALKFFTDKLDFRLDMIMPADDPRVAIVSKDGESVRLEQDESGVLSNESGVGSSCSRRTTPDSRLRHDEGEWKTGRAGMEYRDLIPDRCGGRVVASLIRLATGGEVEDHVHYHKVAFQMIFCLSGAIKVVYEDQGEPFWLRPGDCVLQPPEIRHRVLEAEAGSEVVEVGCPAVHETWVDHEMQLPTAEYRPHREFGGQRFVRHVANDAKPRLIANNAVSMIDTGIAQATGELASVSVVTLSGELGQMDRIFGESDSMVFLFVIGGRLQVGSSEGQGLELDRHDSILEPHFEKLTPAVDETCTFLAVNLPFSP